MCASVCGWPMHIPSPASNCWTCVMFLICMQSLDKSGNTCAHGPAAVGKRGREMSKKRVKKHQRVGTIRLSSSSLSRIKTEQKKKKKKKPREESQPSLLGKLFWQISSSNAEKHSIKSEPVSRLLSFNKWCARCCAVAWEKWKRRGEEWETEFN